MTVSSAACNFGTLSGVSVPRAAGRDRTPRRAFCPGGVPWTRQWAAAAVTPDPARDDELAQKPGPVKEARDACAERKTALPGVVRRSIGFRGSAEAMTLARRKDGMVPGRDRPTPPRRSEQACSHQD